MSTYGITCMKVGIAMSANNHSLPWRIVLLIDSLNACMPESGQSDCQHVQDQEGSYSLPACPQQTYGAA